MGKVKITKDIVLKVKEYKSSEKYSNLTQAEIALLCGTTTPSVSRILNGEYDFLLSDLPKVTKTTNDVTTVIPYEQLKHLLACEYAIEAMFNMTKLSDRTESTLFIDYRAVFSILTAYVPEKVDARLKELKEREEVV
jgi:transcriptional regulator with XRE-family HTH domain